MSERIYSCLLRLYPATFRRAYGDAALELFRDRLRDERGFFKRLRLCIDLFVDLAVSVPHAYRRSWPALVSASAQHLGGIPSFQVLEDEPLPPAAIFAGSVLAFAALAALFIVITSAGELRPLHVSESTTQPPASFRASAPQSSTGQLPARAEEQKTTTSGVFQSLSSHSKLQGTDNPFVPIVNDDGKLDAVERKRVIDGAILNLKKNYVRPDVAQEMADALLAHEQHGDDDGATDGTAFAALLSGQLREVSHDMHLRVTYSLTPVQTTNHPDEPTPEQIARYRSDMERTNCTFEKVEILPHNIGYVKLNSFPHPSVCGAKVAAVMKSLNQVDEIIFDVRDNGGGFPPMVTTMISYLFDRPTHVNDMYTPRTDLTQHYWTKPMPGNRLADKPAYVLTSASTFSGAEEFSYDLKMLKRATLVGETTGGGAHPASRHRIDDHFAIDVPFARPINPISKTDWEGTGVEPDVKVKAADALATAEKLAKNHLRNR